MVRVVHVRTVVIAVLVVALMVPHAAVAQTKTPERERSRRTAIDRRIDTLKSELSELSEEEAGLRDQLAASRRERQQLDARLGDIGVEIAVAETALAAATEQLAAVEAELARLEERLKIARSRLRKAEDELRDRAVAAYITHPAATMAGAVWNAGNIRELTNRTGYASAAIEAQERTINRYRTTRDDIGRMRSEQHLARDRASAERDAVAQQRAVLEEKRNAHVALRAAAAEQESEERNLLADVRKQKAKYEAELAALRRESDSISAFLRAVQAGQRVAGVAAGRITSPLPGARMSSPFGQRIHPIFGTVRMHTGIDYAAPSGTPVRAAASGVVVYAGARGGYGNTIIIDHGESIATLYAHLSVISVSDGRRVGRGEVIGAVGSTGFSTGPHLHFEVRIAGNPVDPLPYF